MNDPAIGVIGTGHFASYFIAALRRGGYGGRILLSPHSRSKAETIAREQDCEVAEDDLQLLANADWVLIAVRPEQLERALAKLVFRPDHLLLSAVAGVSVAEMRQHLGNSTTVVRIMPSSYIEAMPDGLIPLFPEMSEVQRVLTRAGRVVAFKTERDFDLSTVGACLSGWIYHFMGSLAGWFVERGLTPDEARCMVVGNIAGAVALAKACPGQSLSDISNRIATEGTYTKAGLDVLMADDATAPWLKAMDEVCGKLS